MQSTHLLEAFSPVYRPHFKYLFLIMVLAVLLYSSGINIHFFLPSKSTAQRLSHFEFT